MAAGFLRFTKRFFIICNVAAGIFFLLSCYGSSLNPQRFWFIGLLTLASLYILLILVFFIFFWMIVRIKFSLISLAFIALSWSPIKQLIQFRSGSEIMSPKANGSLRVMSWNVEHFDILEHKTRPETKDKMLALINKYEPDVACFQEMVAGDKDPSAINYLQQLQEDLGFPYAHYSYNSMWDFDNKHHFGIIILSKLPLINKHTISFEPNDYNSIFQYADIAFGGDTVRVINLHLQSLRFSEKSRKYLDDPTMTGESDLKRSKNIIAKLKWGFLKRKVQSEHIRNCMDSSKMPMVVCGDFNDVPNSYSYRLIGQNLNNAFAEKGSGIGRTFSGISPTLRIDNIFADRRFEINQFVRVNKKLSDHFPIIADLQLRK